MRFGQSGLNKSEAQAAVRLLNIQMLYIFVGSDLIRARALDINH